MCVFKSQRFFSRQWAKTVKYSVAGKSPIFGSLKPDFSTCRKSSDLFGE